MAITQFTPMKAMQLAVNAVNINANLLPAERYTGIVIGHALSTSQTYQFQAVATGYYGLIGYQGLCLLTVGTPYTETGGVSSTFHCGWSDTAPNIVVTTGTQTGDTISVTATPIDWQRAMVTLCDILKSHAAIKEDATGMAGAYTSFGAAGGMTLFERIDLLQQQYRGAIYV